MAVNDAGEIRRDMACFHLSNPDVYARAECVVHHKDAKRFELSLKEERPGEYFLWEQKNVKLPRKEVVPVFSWIVELPPPFDDTMLESSATLLGLDTGKPWKS